MCRGGRLVADFRAGADTQPDVPEALDQYLTLTTDGQWVVWAYKLARPQGELFVPLTGGSGYPADARATCRPRWSRVSPGVHAAPDPRCSCGFHALSDRELPGLPAAGRLMRLTVILSGRVLAFDWQGTGILWRAERQTVVRAEPLIYPLEHPAWPDLAYRRGPAVPGLRRERLPREQGRPDDPDGRLASLTGATPRDSGPVRLRLPASAPVVPVSQDDAGWCLASGAPGVSAPVERPAALVLA
jgi:hypothetical protein